MASDPKFSAWYFEYCQEHNRTPSQEEVWQGALAAVKAEPAVATDAQEAVLVELNHRQWLSLENVRLLAARHRKEEWAQHMLRFVADAGVNASPIRALSSDKPDSAKTPKVLDAYGHQIEVSAEAIERAERHVHWEPDSVMGEPKDEPNSPTVEWAHGYEAGLRDAKRTALAASAKPTQTDPTQPWTVEHLRNYPTEALAILNAHVVSAKPAGEPRYTGGVLPLPEPIALVAQFYGEWRETVSAAAQPVFTADQMHEYAARCLLAANPPGAGAQPPVDGAQERIEPTPKMIVAMRNELDTVSYRVISDRELACAYKAARAALSAGKGEGEA